MSAFVEAGLLVMAGFVLFCVPLAAVSWYTGARRRLWAASALWAVFTALLAVATVQLVAMRADPTQSGGWFSLRHTLIGLCLLAFFWVLAELSDYVPKWIIAALIVVLLLRDILWFSTDEVWTHSFDAAGNAVYGPLRDPFSLAIGILTLLAILLTTTRAWESSSARKLTLFVIVPGVVVGTIASTMSGALGPISDLVTVAVFAFPILIIQANLLHEASLHSQRLDRLRLRDALLTQFSAQVLAPGGGAPARGAIDLMTNALGQGRYAYYDMVDGRPRLVAQSLGEPISATAASLVVPIVVKGRTAAQLVLVGEADDDDQMFVHSLGYVLSAALARAEMEDDARKHALHNSLTGLPNWLLLQDRLARLLSARGDRTVAVWCCDVADMKAINDDFGHRACDAVLKELGRRLQEAMGQSATVAHIGADEYAVALLVVDEDQAVGVSSRISGISHHPVSYQGKHLRFGVRVGLAVADLDDAAIDADRLIRDAEMALMQAKRRGCVVATYDAVDRQELEAARRVHHGLKSAIRDGQLFVEYQPIVNLATGETAGVEALARWRTPSGDLVPPDVFIPVAEDNSLIMMVTRQIFSEALRQLDEWGRADPALADLGMSLNMTPSVVVAPDFMSWLTGLLSELQIAPQRLTLELTESAAISAQEYAVSRMDELHARGISISLDDFGTGHSSFNRLMALPVGELKIDRMFTQGSGGPHHTIVPAVVGLAKDAGLRVVAEGIETKEQLRKLQDLDCDYGQGYLFSRPVAGSQIPAIVASSPHLMAKLSVRVRG